MADSVTTTIVGDSQEYIEVHLTNISDGTGETAVVKVDKSTLLASDGAEPASLDMITARWNIQGFTSVRILWDHTTDDVAMVLSGGGFEDFTGRIDRNQSGKMDPRSTGGTGDVLLTTAGGSSGATYDIALCLRKNPT